ncbi:hypothetical protein B0A49_12718, partial [Cryomyces minteri]
MFARQILMVSRSNVFGNERFKPRQVVRSPEEAAGASKGAFDYVLLCIKALPDVYDIAAVIESVVSPQHTCILINTTHTIGIESYLEQRFPTNVVLSLVSGAEIMQSGPSDFEHRGATNIWAGPANRNPAIPASIQSDMAEALAMTLSSGQVDCRVSPNIRQQQYERMIGPIAFHPLSVLFETPNHAELLEKVGVRSLVTDTIDELLQLASRQGCTFPLGFREQTMEEMIRPTEAKSIMYQDFSAKRPMEVETYLGSPVKLAQEAGIQVPRIETLYALLHHINIVNQTRPSQGPTSPIGNGPLPPRLSSAAVPRGPTMNGPMNGSMNGPMNGPMNGTQGRNGMRSGGSRTPSMTGGPQPHLRRGPPPSMNGYPPRVPNGNAYPPRGPPQQMTRRPSFEGNDLEEFGHLMLYDNVPEGGLTEGSSGVYGDGTQGTTPIPSSSSDLALRERELMLRQKELALKEQEYNMRRGQQRMPPPPASHAGGFDDDDDDDDFFDPMAARGPPPPQIDPDNFDMMSVTSRRTRKAPSASQLRKNPEMDGGPRQNRNPFSRSRTNGNRASASATSARLMADVPGLHDSIMNNPMMGYSSDRYGGVDRHKMGQESRTNSLTAERLNELQRGGGAGYNGGYPTISRRTSQSPGNPLGPGGRGNGNGRPSPPNGYHNGMNGMQPNGRPSPPGVRAPVPRHPPGHGNAVAPQQVEQHAG